MAGTDKNLYNSPSSEAIREVCFRRLGINIAPALLDIVLTDGILNLTAKPTAPDGTRSPYLGSIAFPLERVSVTTQLPPVLVWSENYPMSVAALADYLMKAYGYYLEDGEFIGVGDDTATPLVRGGMVQAAIDPATRRFRLQATDASLRWTPGSTVTFQQAVSRSVEGEDGLVFLNSPPNGVLGSPYDFTYQMAGGRAPLTFVVEQGTPLVPLSVEGRMQSDTVPPLGTYHWIVLATDADGTIARQEVTVDVVTPGLVFNPPTVTPNVIVGEPVDIDLGISGGVLPLVYAIYSGAFPSSLKITTTPATGEAGRLVGFMDGNPNAAATAVSTTFGLRVKDATGAQVNRIFTITANDRPVPSILSALRSKVLHWYAAESIRGGVWHDATGREDLQVSGTLAPTVGPAGMAAVDMSGGFAVATTTANNLTANFAVMAWSKMVDAPETQYVISRYYAYGQYDVLWDSGNAAWTVDIRTPTSTQHTTAPAAIPVDTWGQYVFQRFGSNVEFVANAGTVISRGGPTGDMLSNTTTPLTLGQRAGDGLHNKLYGELATIAVFTDKLWSDERKWLYNAGSGRAYAEFAVYPTPSVLIDLPLRGGDGTTETPDGTGSTWIPQGTMGLQLSTAVDPAGALYFPGTDQSLQTTLTNDFALVPGFTLDMDVYAQRPQAMLLSAVGSTVPLVVGFDGGSGSPGDSDGLMPYAGWFAGGDYSRVARSTKAIALNTWQSLKVVWDTTQVLRVFLNGHCVARKSVTTAGRQPTGSGFQLGQAWDSEGPLYQGYLREVHLTNAVTYDPPTIEGTFPSMQAGVPYTASIQLVGGNGDYLNPRVVSGVLPAGLTLTIGVTPTNRTQLFLSGTPTAAFTAVLTLAVDSGDGQAAVGVQTLTSEAAIIGAIGTVEGDYLQTVEGDYLVLVGA